jgi:hypothetical protein
MSQKHRTLHLVLSSSVAVAFIVSSYVFSGPLSFRPSTVDAASAEALLKSYATKDSDSDRLPDWQEALYGTDPANPESVKIGVLDGDAVKQGLVKPKLAGAGAPTDTNDTSRIEGSVEDSTITAQFARQFFTSYLTEYGGSATLTDEQLFSFTEKAVAKLLAEHPYVPAFTNGKITIGGSGPNGLTIYSVSAEKIFAKVSIPSEKDALGYMSDYVERNNPQALEQVRKIAKAYDALAEAYVAVPVPSEAVSAHLAVANAYQRASEVTAHLGAADTDPLRALMGLMLYQDAADALTTALASLARVYTAQGVTLTVNDAGYVLYYLAHTAAQTTP